MEQSMEQLYSEAAGKFLADRFVSGTCPKCGYEVSHLSCYAVANKATSRRVPDLLPAPLAPLVCSHGVCTP